MTDRATVAITNRITIPYFARAKCAYDCHNGIRTSAPIVLSECEISELPDLAVKESVMAKLEGDEMCIAKFVDGKSAANARCQQD